MRFTPTVQSVRLGGRTRLTMAIVSRFLGGGTPGIDNREPRWTVAPGVWLGAMNPGGQPSPSYSRTIIGD